MNAREQARALILIRRLYDFIWGTRDTSNPTFASTAVALKRECADFLCLDVDPPRAATVPAAAKQVVQVPDEND